MPQHFFCNAMPVGEIKGEVAIVRFLMDSPIEHDPLAGIDGVFTPHAARAAAEVFSRLAVELERRRAHPTPVAVFPKPRRPGRGPSTGAAAEQ
ncbi:hypothetical protein GC169_12115 [bacterium]|nr:hypothetical protein [bacterium]